MIKNKNITDLDTSDFTPSIVEQKINFALQADEMGYPIAGFVSDVFVGARVIIPSGSSWDILHPDVLQGEILYVQKFDVHTAMVIFLEDGVQLSIDMPALRVCHFALPKESEN